VRAFRRARPHAVLAEFGHAGVQVLDACRRLGLPLIVCFYGFDVYARPMLERYGVRYPELFDQAAALIVVSESMRRDLIALGAPAAKTHYVASGVDLDGFRTGAPDEAPPTFLAVGRFVEKKGPHLTIAAFASVRQRHPEVRLRMIGDGRLRAICEDLARGLGLDAAIDFLGTQSHDALSQEMRAARAFVQHSVVASDGNSEGMPISILEASATGLPIVATRHAGIPEAVVDGETGLLVDERDVSGMAAHMERLVGDPAFAAALGRAGRRYVEKHFSLEVSLARLWDVIYATAASASTSSSRA